MKSVRAKIIAAAVAVGSFSATFFPPCSAVAADASVDQDVEAFARVVVDSADLRTGPGVSFRVIYTAHRGETLALDSRPGSGYWLKVTLADGRSAYALGDEVEPFAVHDDDKNAPSRPGFFAPPPLAGAHGGLAIVGGVFNGPTANGSRESMGYLEARPSIVIDKTLSLDGFLGDALTSNGSEILYGGGATVYLFPTWALCPFVGIGGGGISTFPNSDSFVLKREDLFLARAGGGLLFALRSRILVRLEVTNMTLFNSETYRSAQTYAGGFGVYF